MPPYGFRPATVDINFCRRKPDVEEVLPNCPRCGSSNTKFCYYNNYNLRQPRYLCKGCRRYWTAGGSLRNVPVGGRRRKNCPGKSTTSSREPAISDRFRRPSSSYNSRQPDAKLVDMVRSWLPFQQTAADSGNNEADCGIDNGHAVSYTRCMDAQPPGVDVPRMTTEIHHVEMPRMDPIGSSSNSDEHSQFQFHLSCETNFLEQHQGLLVDQRLVNVADQLRNMNGLAPSVDLYSNFQSRAMAVTVDQGNDCQCDRHSAPCLMLELAKNVQVFEGAPTGNSIMPWTARASLSGLHRF